MNKIEWISVNDKLPEEEKAVLVCIGWKRIEIAYLYIDDWYSWTTNFYIEKELVTHWAELPELPKEE